ncbi:hypothetical protein ACET3Z_009250 [Daucus carota]
MEEVEHRIFIGDCVDSQLEELGLRDISVWNSEPFLFLDLIWNFPFVVVSVFVLLFSIREKPSTPLRVWIGGYALLCLVHLGFVCFDYLTWNSVDFEVNEDDGYSVSVCRNRLSKRLQSVYTVISSFWWAVGFYWTLVGDKALMQDSPRLFWLAVTFLAFEVLFVMFCIGMASIILLIMFCYFPVVATIEYISAIGKGASEDDLRTLSKFHYTQKTPYSAEKQDCELAMEPDNEFSTPKLVLHPNDSECCICLHSYVEGAELCRLQCRHHFHHKCINKWLRINATCPLCKLSIIRGEMLV